MKFGVVQFPGSCDHRDALDAARRVADPPRGMQGVAVIATARELDDAELHLTIS